MYAKRMLHEHSVSAPYVPSLKPKCHDWCKGDEENDNEEDAGDTCTVDENVHALALLCDACHKVIHCIALCDVRGDA